MSQVKRPNNTIIFQQIMAERIYANVKTEYNIHGIRTGKEVKRSLTVLAQHIAFDLVAFIFNKSLNNEYKKFTCTHFTKHKLELNSCDYYPLFAPALQSSKDSNFLLYINAHKEQQNDDEKKILSYYNSINVIIKRFRNHEKYENIQVEAEVIYILSYLLVKTIKNLAFSSLTILQLSNTKTVTHELILTLLLNKFNEYKQLNVYKNIKKSLEEYSNNYTNEENVENLTESDLVVPTTETVTVN